MTQRPLAVEAELTIDAPRSRIVVRGRGGRIVADCERLAGFLDMRHLWRSLPGSRLPLAGSLTGPGLTLDLRWRSRALARLGADARPGFIVRALLGSRVELLPR